MCTRYQPYGIHGTTPARSRKMRWSRTDCHSGGGGGGQEQRAAAAEEMIMMMMVVVIPVITVVGTGEIRDRKNYNENFNDYNKIILKRVEEDKLLESLTPIQ